MRVSLSTIVLPASYITGGSMPAFSSTSVNTSLQLSGPTPLLQARHTPTNAIETMNEPYSTSTSISSWSFWNTTTTQASSNTTISTSTSTSTSTSSSPPKTTMVTITVALSTSTTTSHSRPCWHTSPTNGPPGGMCLCTDNRLWAISPVLLTQAGVLTVDACPYTAIPSVVTSTAYPSLPISTSAEPTTTTAAAAQPEPTTAKECGHKGYGFCWVNGQCIPSCQSGFAREGKSCYQWEFKGCPPSISIGIF